MSNVPAVRNDYAKLNQQLITRADEFKAALPSHITPARFQRTIMTAVQADPNLLGADRASLITSCLKAAQDGLLPDGREAALVVYNTRKKDGGGRWVTVKRVQYMPMVYGLRKKILQSGEITDIQTSVVYRQEIDAGLFVYEEGTDRMLRHKPLLAPDFDPVDEDIAAAYSVATFKDGSKSFEVMPRREIKKVRQASQTGALGRTDYKGNPIPPKGPWVDWFSEMARKSVMRRHAKTLPMSGDIIDVEAMDDAIAAHSTAQVLAHEVPETEETPHLPPSDFEQEYGLQGALPDAGEATHDPETGEVIEPSATQETQESAPKPAGGWGGKANAYVEALNAAPDIEALMQVQAEHADTIARMQSQNNSAYRKCINAGKRRMDELREAEAADAPAAEGQEEML